MVIGTLRGSLYRLRHSISWPIRDSIYSQMVDQQFRMLLGKELEFSSGRWLVSSASQIEKKPRGMHRDCISVTLTYDSTIKKMRSHGAWATLCTRQSCSILPPAYETSYLPACYGTSISFSIGLNLHIVCSHLSRQENAPQYKA